MAPVADDVRGEEVFALVKLAAEAVDDPRAQLAEEIARACAERLAYFKVPGYVAFVDTIPVTATQKLQRSETRRGGARAVGAPGTIDLREFKSTAAPARQSGSGMTAPRVATTASSSRRR